MTSTSRDPSPESAPPHRDPLALLLELTARAWGDVLTAEVEEDHTAARRVLAGARQRRAAAWRAEVEARSRLSQARIVLTARRLVRSANTVQLVADVERLEQLLVVAARRVLAGEARLGHHLVPHVRTLGRAGERRLHDLAEGAIPGRCDPTFLACGHQLSEIRACLAQDADGPRRPGDAVGLCMALAAGVLEASRHAARAA